MDFHNLNFPFEFSSERNYFSRYLKWKRDIYYSFIGRYRQLILNEAYLVCKQCTHIEPIERLYMYNPNSGILQLN